MFLTALSQNSDMLLMAQAIKDQKGQVENEF